MPGVALHTSHAPPHAVLQQNPSAQKPLVHCVARRHDSPLPCAGTHAAPSQKKPAPHCPSVVQPVGQPALPAAHRYGVQLGLPTAPPGVEQVPGVALHTSHAPAHAELQQNPSAQKPDRHWLASVHEMPLTCLGTHAPPEQK